MNPRPEDVAPQEWGELMAMAEEEGWTLLTSKRLGWWRDVTFRKPDGDDVLVVVGTIFEVVTIQ